MREKKGVQKKLTFASKSNKSNEKWNYSGKSITVWNYSGKSITVMAMNYYDCFYKILFSDYLIKL